MLGQRNSAFAVAGLKWLAVVLCIVCFLNGCKRGRPGAGEVAGNEQTTQTGMPGDEKGKLPDNLTLGAVLDLTGAAAPYGEWSKKGLDLAVDDLNTKGVHVTFIVEDGQSDPKSGVSAFTKLATVDRVPAIIMTTVSGSIMACAPIAERHQVVLFAPGSSSPDISNAGDFIFRNRISGTYEVQKAAEVAARVMGFNRMAMLLVNNEFGRSYGEEFRKAYGQAGGTTVYTDYFPQSGTDFRTQLTKLKGVECDGVFLVGQVAECAYILKQATELGVHTKWMSTIGIENPKLIEIAGEAANGVMYTAPRYETTDAETREFERRYYERYHEHSQMYAANTYDAVHLLVHAVRGGGASGPGIGSELYKIKDYPGVSGLTTFDAHGDVLKPVVLREVKEGKFVTVQQSEP